MLSIGKLAPGPGAASYYLDRVGCPLDYYLGRGESQGVWIGRGADDAGLHGRLDTEQAELHLRLLLDGTGLDGTRLVQPVLRADPRSRVPSADVARLLTRASDARDLDVSELLSSAPGGEQLEKVWQRLRRELDGARRRPRWPAPALPADTAGRLLAAAGLDPHSALGELTATGRFRDRLARALRFRDDRVDVRLPGLDLTLSAPKSVSVLYALTLPEPDHSDHPDRSDRPEHPEHPVSGRSRAGVGGDSGAGGSVSLVVQQAHRLAVSAAVDYLDLTCARALRGRHSGDGSDQRIDTRGLVGAAFEHRSSRCGDPQLHTHVVVANLLHGVDGKWSALDTREIYAQARTAGFVYQAVLRGELTRTLGVGWGQVRNGQAEMTGLPSGLLRLFSKRRAQIEGQLDQLGLDGPRAAQAATLATRPAKPTRSSTPASTPTSTAAGAATPAAGVGAGSVEGVSLRDQWRREATAAGYPDGVLLPVLNRVTSTARVAAARAAAAVSGPVAEQLAARLLAPEGLTSRRSTFDRKDLLRGVCESLPVGTPVSLTTLRALATRVLREDRVVPLLSHDPTTTIQARRYTTSELLLLENDALNLATARTSDGAAVVPPALLAAAEQQARNRGLSSEQSVMLRQLLSSGAGVEVVVGAAGSGKTAALAVAVQAWSAAGITVRGTALAAIAANVLHDSAGVPAVSLHRLLSQHQPVGTQSAADSDPTPRPAGGRPGTPAAAATSVSALGPPPGCALALPPGGVLIVDEAGMVGTRTLHQLLQLTAQTHTKLVLVGDPKQLPEIDAGGLFATLAGRLPAARLVGNQRQSDEWEQRALRELRDGDVLHALSAYRRHGRLRITDTPAQLTTQLLIDYLQARSTHPAEQVLVVTSSRGDARRLNTSIRQHLLTHGALGTQELRIPLTEASNGAAVAGGNSDGAEEGGERGYRVGEQVLVTANDYPRGLLNGTRGTVTDLDLRDQAVGVRLKDGRQLSLNQAYLRTGHLTHGYALTAHKAQGTTVDVALLWGTHALTRETAYVAMSRGRHSNYLYATWDILRRDTNDHNLDRPSPTSRPDRLARRGLARAAVTQRLASSSRQRLARSWTKPTELPTAFQPQPLAGGQREDHTRTGPWGRGA